MLRIYTKLYVQGTLRSRDERAHCQDSEIGHPASEGPTNNEFRRLLKQKMWQYIVPILDKRSSPTTDSRLTEDKLPQSLKGGGTSLQPPYLKALDSCTAPTPRITAQGNPETLSGLRRKKMSKTYFNNRHQTATT